MTTDRIRALSSLLQYAGGEILSHFASEGDLALFARVGLLVPAGIPTLVPCEACDEGHFAEVVVTDNAPRGLCLRTGASFSIARRSEAFHVEPGAAARGLARALQLDDVRLVAGYSCLWRLGARRVTDVRVNFFFTPDLSRLDLATSILQAVYGSAAMTAALIVANDRLDHVRLMSARITVIRVRDIAGIANDGAFVIDEEQLVSAVCPHAKHPRRQGAPPLQRNRIIPILDEMSAEGEPFDSSNASCRTIRERYRTRYSGSPPGNSTIRTAIEWWKSQRV